MSKERARRRAERERETAMRTFARAAEVERRERRRARTAAVRRWSGGRSGGWPGRRVTGRQSGVLAARRRLRARALLAVLVLVNVVVWCLTPDWASRLGALVLCLLAAPLLVAVLVVRR
jgi:Flp pilus assembly protein TadB